MQGIITLIFINLIIAEVFAHFILWDERNWWHLLPFGALIHLIYNTFKDGI